MEKWPRVDGGFEVSFPSETQEVRAEGGAGDADFQPRFRLLWERIRSARERVPSEENRPEW